MKKIDVLVLGLLRRLRKSLYEVKVTAAGICALCLITGTSAIAEGTAQFYSAAQGGRVPFVYAAGAAGKSTYFVSVAAGETIYMGSSALANNGVGGAASLANITLIGPVLNTVQGTALLESGPWARNCKVDQPTAGFMTTRVQELAGPAALAAGGYTACSYVVPAGQGGIYEVAIWGTDGPNTANAPIATTVSKVFGPTICTTGNCNNQGARAWDVTVSNTGLAQPGRVWTNGLNLNSGSNSTTSLDARVYGKIFVQTKDGFTYGVDTNGLDPFAANFYSNNKGVQSAGAPAYTSVQQSQVQGTFQSQTPNIVDTATSWINRIFFNTPSAAALSSLNTASGFATSPQAISITNLRFVGAEGGTGVAGTAPLGGFFKFDSNLAASAQVTVDLNNDGIFGNSNDRIIANAIVAGANSLAWDGRDSAGVAAVAGVSNTNIQISFNVGEVHFPVIDAESSQFGFIITNGGVEVPQYWNDKRVTSTATPGGTCAAACGPQGGLPSATVGSVPALLSNLTGATVLRHIWGDGGTSATAFGDTKVIDTWTYFPTAPQNLSVLLRQSDLSVTKAKIAPAGSPQTGQVVTYSVVANNTGTSAVTGAVLIDALPTGATAITVTSATPTAAGSCGIPAVAGLLLTVTGINLANAEKCTYVVETIYTTAGFKTNQAAIQRPADVTDPTATNADAAVPVNTYAGVQAECNAAVAGSGNGTNANLATAVAPTCNNLAWSTIQVMAPTTPNLSLTKTNPASFTVGSAANYQLSITNAAGALTSAASIVVNDKLPPNFAFNSATFGAGATAASCASSGTQSAGLDLVCTITTAAGIAAGSSATFTINVTPQAAAGTVPGTNRATVSPTGGTPGLPASCTATGTPAGCVVAASITPAAAAVVNLSLAKSNPTSLNVGVASDYLLTISNAAGAATSAASVVVNDKLPPNFVFNSAAPGAGAATASCVSSGTQAAGLDLVCTITTAAGIAAGGNAVFSVNATPQAAADGVLGSNKATINPAGGAPGDPSLCTATGTPVGCAVAPPIAPPFAATVNLSLAKSNPASLTAGVAADYVLVVSNAAGAATSGTSIVVNDKLPPNIAFNSTAIGTGVTAASCVATGALATGLELSCTITTAAGITGGATASFTINVTPQAAAVGIAGSNQATVNPAGGAPAPASLCTATGTPAGCAVAAPITPGSAAVVNLSLTKSNPANFIVGVAADYLLIIGNGVGAATSGLNVVINDKLPPNFTFNSAAPGAGSTAASCVVSGVLATGLDLVCSITTVSGITAGATAAFMISVTPQTATGGVLGSNKATVSPTGGTPSDPSLCTATGTPAGCVVAAPIAPAPANLGIAKSNPTSLVVGVAADYVLTISNAASAATSPAVIVVNDKLPPHFAFNSATLGTATTAATCLSSGTAAAGFDLVCTVTTTSGIAAGASAAFTINVTPQALAGDVSSINKAAVSPTGATPVDPATCTASGTPLGCVLAAPITPLTSDMSVSFDIPTSAPVGTTVNGTVSFANVGANAAVNPTVTLQLSPGLVGVVINGGTLGAGVYNATSGQVSFPNAPPASLAAGNTLSVAISYTQPNSPVAITATSSATNDTNTGNNSQSANVGSLFADVTTSIILPINSQVGTTVAGTVVFTNSSAAGATATNTTGIVTLSNGQVITFDLANVAPGASITRTFNIVLPNAVTTAVLVGTSTVSTSTPESNTTNNSATANTIVLAPDSSVSGRVFIDINRNRIYDSGDQLLPGYRVELVRVSGTVTTVVGTAITDISGNYFIGKQFPGSGYKVQFRDPAGNLLLGTPFNQTNLTANGNPSTGNNSLTSAISPGATVTVAGFIDNVTLYAGDNAIQQNLPLDPNGIVYDSVTRLPIAGATVRLVGPAGFDPATHLLGGSNLLVTSASGLYQFLFVNNPPSGLYTLEITPPSGYSAPNAVLGGVALPQGTLAVPQGILNVQPQTTAPSVGTNGVSALGSLGTQYFLSLNFNFSTPGEVFNNHIPLDPASVQSLFIEKLADKGQAEIGDSILYRIRVKNPNAFLVPLVKIVDKLPLGFKVIPGTTTLQQGTSTAVAMTDGAIMGFPGPVLTFATAGMAANSELVVTYRVRVGVGADKGTGVNTAQASDGAGTIKSLVARAAVRVTAGVFTTDACVLGKVYMHCNPDVQDKGLPGIPGVRLYLENGTSITTDENGQYSLCGLRPITHVLKIDANTAPLGASFGVTSSRNAGDGDSLFLDLKNGELHRADFREQTCSPSVIEQVQARRRTGLGGVQSTDGVKSDSIGVQFNSDEHRPGRVPGFIGVQRSGATTVESK